MKSFSEGPRIYNLFPRLVGKVSSWHKYLTHIKKLNFNWVFINPINSLGFSGSLYSIKDHFQLNPEFAEDEADQKSWQSVKSFIQECHNRGIHVMMDLVINHTAIDMVKHHPDWFAKKWVIVNKGSNLPVRFIENMGDLNEEPSENPPEIDLNKYPPDHYKLEYRVANPYAIDPANAENITIWGDLAQINYMSPVKEEILKYWKKLLTFYIQLGVDGYRCDAAYQIPGEIWQELVLHVRSKDPKALFWAETLGARLKDYEKLKVADFDYIASSSKYWDYTQPWCIEQYNNHRQFAKTISFPESHDTKRLAKETGGRLDVQIFKYLFASFFSAGVMIPIGYEYGFEKPIHVVHTQPDDIEEPSFDIREEITYINFFKQSFRCLNENGEITHFPHPNSNILFLKKESISQNEALLMIYNKNWQVNQFLEDINLSNYFSSDNPIYEVTIKGGKTILSDDTVSYELTPNSYKLYYSAYK